MILKLSVLICLSLAHSFCGPEETQLNHFLPPSRHLVKRSSSLSQIRISYFYIDFTLGSPDLDTEFKSKVLPAVDSFLTSSLKVTPVSEDLQLASASCSGVDIPDEHSSDGIPDTDVAVYITSTSSTSATYIAAASPCQLQSNSPNNVIAGRVTISILPYTKSIYSTRMAILLHEMTHLLGLSMSITKYWKDSSGNPYPNGPLTTAMIRGSNKTILATPNVLAQARSIFDCQSIKGVEIEDFYDKKSTNSFHWDRRIMMNEYMTAVLHSDPYVSAITLAALQDTGWYTVDYKLATNPIFGATKGCSFFNEKCVVNGKSGDSSHWCSSKASFLCDFFALNRGSCSLTNYSSGVPAAYQYFSTPTQGGSDAYSDYCPYTTFYSNGRCRLPNTKPYTLKNANEVIGLNSRCFVSNLVLSPFTQSPPYSACYQVFNCTSTSATVVIGDKTLVCPFTGGTFTVEGYTGTITCPDSNILCQNVPCVGLCSGKGLCKGGFCECFPGYGGDDCSVVCSSDCLVCSDIECLACASKFALVNGTCTYCLDNNECNLCDFGYEFNGICVPCTPPCLTCLSDTVCTSYSYHGNEVYQCPINCASCKDNLCLSCKEGYYLTEFSTCVSCLGDCFGSMRSLMLSIFILSIVN